MIIAVGVNTDGRRENGPSEAEPFWKAFLRRGQTTFRRRRQIPNDEAVVHLVGALMLEQNDEWAVGRRYMSLESLATLSDDPILTGCPPWPPDHPRPNRGPTLLHHAPGHDLAARVH